MGENRGGEEGAGRETFAEMHGYIVNHMNVFLFKTIRKRTIFF